MKWLSFLILLFIPVLLLPQGKTKKQDNKGIVDTAISPLSLQSKDFSIKSIDFNKRIDIKGRGEILEVVMVLKNNTDNPIDLYVFTIATYEKTQKTRSSFEKLIPEKEKLRTFKAFPGPDSNFQYPKYDPSGKIEKNKKGETKMRYVKFPKDPKKGKFYTLKNKIIYRSAHLSEYRSNYFYFNEVMVLIFNKEGKPIFRQLYKVIGQRR